MREVTIGGEAVKLMGSAATPWIYEDAFKNRRGDSGDMMAAWTSVTDEVSFGGIPKMAWAMARCAIFPKPFPDFRSWIEQIGGWDFSDAGLMSEVILEATRALFPGNAGMVALLESKLEQVLPDADAPASSGGTGDGATDGTVAD